jgi:hypothetical protein
MTIRVTEEFIKIGKRSKGFDCPVALALTHAGIIGACVGTTSFSYLSIKDSKVINRDWNNFKVQSFINSYDAGKAVEPIEFNLVL